jgi:hypothetical protein
VNTGAATDAAEDAMDSMTRLDDDDDEWLV